MKHKFWVALGLCFSAVLLSNASAKNLGTVGTTYEIAEENILQMIDKKLKRMSDSDDMEKLNQAFKEQASKSIKRPKAVSGIRTTSEARAFTYNPSLTLSQDLLDHQGNIIHPAGSKVNPLDSSPLNTVLLIIDGDDEQQVSWAKDQNEQHQQKTKWILVKGSPFKLMEALDKPVFFDQGGSITTKLGIQQVPAKVFQVGHVLQIEEVLL